jgi:hypothetical protein
LIIFLKKVQKKVQNLTRNQNFRQIIIKKMENQNKLVQAFGLQKDSFKNWPNLFRIIYIIALCFFLFLMDFLLRLIDNTYLEEFLKEKLSLVELIRNLTRTNGRNF